MILLAAAALFVISGSLFLAYELVSAPVGLEDTTGFHTVGVRAGGHPGSKILRSEKLVSPGGAVVFPGTVAR
jgi:hypothetical protein